MNGHPPALGPGTEPGLQAIWLFFHLNGYNQRVRAVFCRTAAIEAFQRHFRPSRIDGVMDRETRGRLGALCR